MVCSKCGADIAAGASFCPRCGTPLGGAGGPGLLQRRRQVAIEAFETGKGPAGVQCPNCGGYRMQAVRIDADATLILAVIALILGGAMLLLAIFVGDAGLYVANTSTLGLFLLLIGVLLLMITRWRRQPKAFECFACGYRVP